MREAGVYTGHAQITGSHLVSTWQRRCCGEQGEKIVSKKDGLIRHSKAIDHSFFRGFTPKATMSLPNDNLKSRGENAMTEIEERWQAGGLPAAGNSSDHIYCCVEYEMLSESKKDRWRQDRSSLRKALVKLQQQYQEANENFEKEKEELQRVNASLVDANSGLQEESKKHKAASEMHEKGKNLAQIAAAVATGGAAIATAGWLHAVNGNVTEKQNSIVDTVMQNKTIAAISTILVAPAVCFSGYKLFQYVYGYFSGSSAETETESNAEEKSVSRSGSVDTTEGNTSETTENNVPKNKYMIPLVVLFLFVVIVAAFSFSGEDASEYPKGDLPIGEDRV